MNARTGFILRDDVTILPVTEVEDSIQAELDCGLDDFVIFQFAGRATSTLVDAETAELLQSFDQAQTVAEAVIKFSLPRHRDPELVLEEFLPLVERFVRQGLLVDADDIEAQAASRQSFEAGDHFDGLSIVRPLQVLDDCELYQVRLYSDFAALKIHRVDKCEAATSTRSGFDVLAREALMLEVLSGKVAPRLLRQGSLEGRPYLLLEWCGGIDSQTAGEEWRRRSRPEARSQLLTLCRRIARSYAQLHGLGILHGDIHPRNLLVDRDLRVKLIDFACAHRTSGTSDGISVAGETFDRPGVPFYFEPEHARAILDGQPPVPVSEAGEQFAVAVLLYYMVTGVHYCDFGLEQQDLFRRIAEAQPVAFSDRGLPPWPELEAVLHRALDQQPTARFPSMTAFADALDALPQPSNAGRTQKRSWAGRHELQQISQDLLAAAELDGPWLNQGLDVAPTASLSYGAAGIAYVLYRVAYQRDDPMALALADVWARRAESEVDSQRAFYNSAKSLAVEDLGQSSPYHTASGVFAVSAMIARARNDLISLSAAIDAFVNAAEKPANGIDLTLGSSGILLVCALLEELRSSVEAFDAPALTELGHRSFEAIWSQLEKRPPIPEVTDEPLGIAHGWAGFLYAALRWSQASGAEPPQDLKRRLGELSSLAVPVGRGLRWLSRHASSRPGLLSGWCQGSAGQVFLWTLAAQQLDNSSYDELALGAAWDAWDGPELTSSLCCGLAGRAYAMLCMYKHTDDRLWLERARDLALRAAHERHFESDFRHSLFKGELVLAILAADLKRPREAVMPFFEPEGW